MLHRFFALGLAIGLSVGPVFPAEYLVQPPDQQHATMVWISDTPPAAGRDIPTGSRIAVRVVQNNDTCISNYQIDATGLLVYAPPVVQTVDPASVPDVEGFKTAIFQSTTIPLQARLELAKTFPLIDAYVVKSPVVIAQYWAGLKSAAAESYPWLTQDVMNAVEALGTQYHIPLVAQ